jgi:hypothetical protein
MMNFTEPASIPSDRPAPGPDQLKLIVAAYLAPFKGSSRRFSLAAGFYWTCSWLLSRIL